MSLDLSKILTRGGGGRLIKNFDKRKKKGGVGWLWLYIDLPKKAIPLVPTPIMPYQGSSMHEHYL